MSIRIDPRSITGRPRLGLEQPGAGGFAGRGGLHRHWVIRADWATWMERGRPPHALLPRFPSSSLPAPAAPQAPLSLGALLQAIHGRCRRLSPKPTARTPMPQPWMQLSHRIHESAISHYRYLGDRVNRLTVTGANKQSKFGLYPRAARGGWEACGFAIYTGRCPGCPRA